MSNDEYIKKTADSIAVNYIFQMLAYYYLEKISISRTGEVDYYDFIVDDVKSQIEREAKYTVIQDQIEESVDLFVPKIMKWLHSELK